LPCQSNQISWYYIVFKTFFLFFSLFFNKWMNTVNIFHRRTIDPVTNKMSSQARNLFFFSFLFCFLLFVFIVFNERKKNDNKFNELLPRFFYLLKVSPMESLLRSSTHFLDKKIAGKKKHFFKNPGRISFYNKSK